MSYGLLALCRTVLFDIFLSFLPGVTSLSQALCSSDDYSNSLLHLDLSKNPGILSGEDATVRAETHACFYNCVLKLGLC